MASPHADDRSPTADDIEFARQLARDFEPPSDRPVSFHLPPFLSGIPGGVAGDIGGSISGAFDSPDPLDKQLPQMRQMQPVMVASSTHTFAAATYPAYGGVFLDPVTPQAYAPQVQPPPPPPPPQPAPGFSPYSTSGFDMLSILAKVVTRPDPQLDLGAVDLACAFCVVDVREQDDPIVYASPSFCMLTGYSDGECVGKNCRFLQSPNGRVDKGAQRPHTAASSVYEMKRSLEANKETQVTLTNYRKGGQEFVNLVTVIPVKEEQRPAYLVGFQVDMTAADAEVTVRQREGRYLGNYQTLGLPRTLVPRDAPYAVSASLAAALGAAPGAATQESLNALLLDASADFVHVLSLKGAILYASARVTATLGYAPAELIGKNITSLCHPSDSSPLLRELKEASARGSPRLALLCRLRAKDGTWVWIESAGRVAPESGKGRRAVLLVGRCVRQAPALTWAAAARAGVLKKAAAQFSCTLTPGGIVASLGTDDAALRALLGTPRAEIIGTSLLERVAPGDATLLYAALASGAPQCVPVGARHAGGHVVQLEVVLVGDGGLAIVRAPALVALPGASVSHQPGDLVLPEMEASEEAPGWQLSLAQAQAEASVGAPQGDGEADTAQRKRRRD